MILQSLVHYYEALERADRITRPGWCNAKVSFGLELSGNGELLAIIPMKQPVQRGKKTVMLSIDMKVPQFLSRSSEVSANFLCDNSSYLLGIDSKGKPERSRKCFLAAKEKHLKILENVNSPAAVAVKHFFQHWSPDQAAENPVLIPYLEEIMAGANLVFFYDRDFAQEDPDIQAAWESFSAGDGGKPDGVCLVTGQKAEIARIHGMIKGLPGAQSSGAALVSFNAPAFESHGKSQSFNAPVGIYAAYAYTTALNYLLADKQHTSMIGDTTIVYWSEEAEEVYQNIFSMAADPTIDNQEILDGVFKNLESGKAVAVGDVETKISMDQPFYILGLTPNAARIAVRFFYRDTFGGILKNLKRHYDEMEIVRPSNDSIEYLGLWRMLQETVNKKSRDKNPVSNMAGAVYRAIISGSRYPNSLYQEVIGRIRADQDNPDNRIYKITRGRAAIIKAYLMRNGTIKKEELTVGLNENCSNPAYVLGREFAVLEAIQEEANPGINATIKDRYFNAACATPAIIFPVLFKLKNSHIRKLNSRNKVIYYETLLEDLQGKLLLKDDQKTACPRRLTLEEQGMFILGYYHQTQKRYEKKEDK